MLSSSNEKTALPAWSLLGQTAALMLLFFFFSRIFFVIYQYFVNKFAIPYDFYKAFVYGLWMDASIWAYCIVIPLLLFFLQGFFSYGLWIKYFYLFFLILFSGICSADAVLYKEWGFRMDITPFQYLIGSTDAGNFISMQALFAFFILFIIHLITSFFIWKKILRLQSKKNSGLWNYAMSFLCLALSIIPMRGGTGLAPLNPSKVYYSKHLFSNHLAINPIWNILYTAVATKKITNNFRLVSKEDAKKYIEHLYVKNDNYDIDSTISTPHYIVVLMLESFTSNLLFKNHHNIEMTPQLNEWTKRGLFFANAISSGDRTDKGIVSVLSGYPSQPQTSIMMRANKSQSLSSLIHLAKKNGMLSHFYYGGDIHFAGMKSYILSSGFDHIIDKDNFSNEQFNAKWGVHDHIIFEKVLDDYLHTPSPFFFAALSLTSHPPYDIPEPDYWTEKDEETQFINAAHYTDKHLGAMLDKMKASARWDSTLLILVADHGCRFPGNVLYHEPAKFHIPVLFTGGVVKMDSISEAIISQQDIAASVCDIMKWDDETFTFSQSVFSNTHHPFAYYSFNNGVAWIDKNQQAVYSLDKRGWIDPFKGSDSSLIHIQHYVQAVWDDFDRR